MPAVRFVHLRTVDAWLRCDHEGTDIESQTAAVRLAKVRPQKPDRVDVAVFAAWQHARSGTAYVPPSPDRLDPLVADSGGRGAQYGRGRGGVLLADREGLWTPEANRGWIRVDVDRRAQAAVDPLRFGPVAADRSRAEGSGLVGAARTLARDPFGRLWALQLGGKRIRLLADSDLGAVAELASPLNARLDHLDVNAQGVLGVDGRTRALWWRRYGGEWALVDLVDAFGRSFESTGSPTGAVPPSEVVRRLENYTPITVAGGPGDRMVVLYRADSPTPTTPDDDTVRTPDRSRTAARWLEDHPMGEGEPPSLLLVLEGRRAHVVEVPELRDPLHMVSLPDGSLMIGDVDQLEAGPDASKFFFTRFVFEGERLYPQDTWLARSFDGRGLLVDTQGRPWATTRRAVRPLFRSQQHLRRTGQLETLALDSGTPGTQWHRVFLDLCLPAGTSIEVWARASEDIYPAFETVERPRAPIGFDATALDAVPNASDPKPSPLLGSRAPDDTEGWVKLDVLDPRAPWVDAALPFRGERPAGDPYARRTSPRAQLRFDTHEGLLRVVPGRYLWLRVKLTGTRRSTPILAGLRATYPRPSLLNFLPAFWRRDPDSARRMDEVLSLFEGTLTELGHRIDALPLLFDPRVCPPEMLGWLANVVGLSVDTRVGEATRRQLILEAFALYRERGTVPGLERLLRILTGSRVWVVENFRMRTPLWMLGDCQPGAALLGTRGIGAGGSPPKWERAVQKAHVDLFARYHARKLEERFQADFDEDRPEEDPRPDPCCEPEPQPCPREEPPCPIDRDPVVAHYRRYAHRFVVLIPRCCDAELAAVVDKAIEAWKPAHTAHDVHWTGGGFQLGPLSYLGLSVLGSGDLETTRAVLGRQTAVLGQRSTLSSGHDSGTRFRAGVSYAGKTTQLG